MKSDQIVEVLHNFNNSTYKRILINGSWGIGKTRYVMKFTESLGGNVCYVSLFGKKDISSVVQEIYFNIIENEPRGRFKKKIKPITDKIGKLNISYMGMSLSVPLIANLEKALNKELGKKETYVIILDDLERKHSDLSIEEVLGLLDRLSKITSIKIVLVAAIDQLDDDNINKFNDYKEKAIDRTYTVDEYAEEAPENILGNKAWKVISRLIEVEKLKFKNLRTFEKTNSFIKEVINELGKEVFTEKFTIDDLYRMCFATVVYNIEHKHQKIFLTRQEMADRLNEDEEIDYLCKYILNNSLDNTMSKHVFSHIKNWFDTGTYSKRDILELINSINNFIRQPGNFFSSEQEIIKIIESSKEYIDSLNGSEDVADVLTILFTALTWAEDLSIEYGISNENIVISIDKNISNRIDVQKGIEKNQIRPSKFNTGSNNARSLLKEVNKAIQTKYYKKLIEKINECLTNSSYDNYHYLKRFEDSLYLIKDSQIIENIIGSIRESDFFFPLPFGEITEEHYNWCVLVNELFWGIERQWDIKGFHKEFEGDTHNKANSRSDKMLKHRLDTLFRQNS